MTDNDSGAPLPPVEPDTGVSPVPAQPPVQPPPHSSSDTAPPGSEPPAGGPQFATSGAKPEIGKRAISYIIDWVIAMVLYAVLAPASPALGSLVGAAYLLLRDGFDFDFMKGRSLGKRMMKLTVQREDGGKMDLATSARRNWTLALSMLPLGLLWFLVAPVALLIGLYEVYLVITSPDGRRWGDKMAATRVLETDE